MLIPHRATVVARVMEPAFEAVLYQAPPVAYGVGFQTTATKGYTLAVGDYRQVVALEEYPTPDAALLRLASLVQHGRAHTAPLASPAGVVQAWQSFQKRI